jgi:putative membrane protein
VKEGRPGDGIVAAVGLIGDVLAEHFPKSSEDSNEIPDKLIEL